MSAPSAELIEHISKLIRNRASPAGLFSLVENLLVQNLGLESNWCGVDWTSMSLKGKWVFE